MDVFSMVIEWAYRSLATWHVAAIIGGVLILIAERQDKKRELSEDDARYVAELYRQYYGDNALLTIGDHMLGASFLPDGRHNRFLRRVAMVLHDYDRPKCNAPVSRRKGSG